MWTMCILQNIFSRWPYLVMKSWMLFTECFKLIVTMYAYVICYHKNYSFFDVKYLLIYLKVMKTNYRNKIN